MTKYIEAINEKELPIKNNVHIILNKIAGSFVLEGPPAIWIEDLVCVIDNGVFQTVFYVSDEHELNDFKLQSQQEKTWMHVPNAKQYTKDV